jgi:hypothetical protein
MIKKYSVTVSAPQEKTFSSLGMDKKFNEWMDGDLTIEAQPRADKDRREGSRFHQTYWPFWELDSEVIAYKKPVLFGVGFKANVMDIKGTIFYNIEYIDADKTKLTCEIDVADGNAAKRTVVKLLAPVIDKAVTSFLKSVKKTAEQESGAQIRD